MAPEKGRVRVAVLMGGMSGEHQVSLNSGKGIVAALPEDRYQVCPVVILEDGTWRIRGPQGEREVTIWKALEFLDAFADVVFPALHGPNGEDGTIQGLLQLMGIRFVGSDSYASALAMNKPRTKDAYLAAGLQTPPSVWVTRRDLEKDPAGFGDRVVKELGLPCVLKTCRLGSSVGVVMIKDRETLEEKALELAPLSGDILVEKMIRGREFTSSVLEDPELDMEPGSLPVVEIRPRVSGWFDYEAKYQVGGSEELCPAPIPDDLTRQIQAIGLTAHRILGCRSMSRTDVIVENDTGIPWVIETNTIPGFTRTSLLPQAAAAAGIDYKTLVDKLIRGALLFQPSIQD